MLSSIYEYAVLYRRYVGRQLYAMFVLTALAALTEGFGIALLLPLLRVTGTAGEVPEDGVQKAFYDFLSWLGIADSFVGILLFIGAVFLLKGALKFAQKSWQGYLQSRLLTALKVRLFDAYTSMGYAYYARKNTGHFINVINDQVNRFYLSFKSYEAFVSGLVTALSYLLITLVLTWRFGLMAVAAGVAVLFLFRSLNAYVRRLSGKMATETGRLNKLLVQALQSFKYVVSTHQTEPLRKGVVGSVGKVSDDMRRQKVAAAFTGAAREPVSVLLVLGVIAIQVLLLDEPLAPILVSIVLLHRGMNAVVSVQKSWQALMDYAGSIDMVEDELAEVSRHAEASGPQKLGALARGIELDGVTFAYDPEDGPVLRDVSLVIPANTTVAFVGESGAGKSTLIDVLTLLLKPQAGEVRIDGVAGPEVDLASWRSQIGYVSQETVVFDDTIANNISLWDGGAAADEEAQRERVRAAARQAYAARFIEELPGGYETVVGDRGVRLSGGQRQRLFIARELYKRPKLLILDEATSALDSESERFIQESIDSLKGAVTVVIIAHRLSTIRNADYIYVMDAGRVVEQGTYDDLTSHAGSRFREMVEMQRL